MVIILKHFYKFNDLQGNEMVKEYKRILSFVMVIAVLIIATISCKNNHSDTDPNPPSKLPALTQIEKTIIFSRIEQVRLLGCDQCLLKCC